MSTLVDLFNKYSDHKGTDKVKTGHAFFYEELFKSLDVTKVNTVLEIGIGRGGSLRTWKDYFVNAEIHGIDNKRDACRSVRNATDSRLYAHKINTGDKKTMEDFAVDNFFDIIIDDGSKVNRDQIIAFECLWKTLTSGGYYILEDVEKSYDSRYIDNEYPLIIDYFTSKLKDIISRSDHNLNKSDIDYIAFRSDMIIIRKR